MLSTLPEIRMKILLESDIDSLKSYCSSHYSAICQDPYFWKLKFEYDGLIFPPVIYNPMNWYKAYNVMIQVNKCLHGEIYGNNAKFYKIDFLKILDNYHIKTYNYDFNTALNFYVLYTPNFNDYQIGIRFNYGNVLYTRSLTREQVIKFLFEFFYNHIY